MDAFFLALFIGIIAVAYFYMRVDFVAMLKSALFSLSLKVPALAALLTFTLTHIAAADIIGISIFGFVSKLFFSPLPIEPYLIYVESKGVSFPVITLFVTLSVVFSAWLNYGVGKLIGKFLAKRSSFGTKLLNWVERFPFVSLMVFLASLLPVPDIASVIFGASHIGYKKFLLWTALGTAAKVVVILVAYEIALPYLQSLHLF